MLTLILAWINSKYDSDYDGLFIVTIIMDAMIIDGFFDIF